MNALHSTTELIRKTNTISELNNFIITLGYRTNPKALHIPSFDLPESAQKKIKEFHNIFDYAQKFQIYFIKTNSRQRTDFQNILEPFYRRYPQIINQIGERLFKSNQTYFYTRYFRHK